MFFQQVVSKLQKALVVSALPVTLIAVLPTTAEAANLYVFGDSLSDNGNLANLPGVGLQNPPYAISNGRFSNGPVWVEYLAPQLGLTLRDFAYGGATTDPNTGANNTINSALPGFPQELQQFTQFKATNPSDPNDLYVIWSGNNDYLGILNQSITNPNPGVSVGNLENSVRSLAGAGAKNIMVVNLPDLGNLPLTRPTQVSGLLNTLAQTHNDTLAVALNNLDADPTLQDVNIIPFDVNSVFKQGISNPGQFGLTNVTDPCYVSATNICANPDQYLFWDGLHPTTAAHSIIANQAYSTLAATPVPFEPSPTLGLVALGAWQGIEQLKKQKRKQKKVSPVKSSV